MDVSSPPENSLAAVMIVRPSPGQAYVPEFTDDGGAAPPMDKHEH